jgi:hypothetical protein
VTTNALYIISLPQIDTEHIPRLLVLRSDQELFAAETPATVQVLGLELYIVLVWYGTRGVVDNVGTGSRNVLHPVSRRVPTSAALSKRAEPHPVLILSETTPSRK